MNGVTGLNYEQIMSVLDKLVLNSVKKQVKCGHSVLSLFLLVLEDKS